MALTNFHEDITDDVQKHAPYGYTTKTNWDNARVRSLTVTLSSADILALNTTDIEIVPSVIGKVHIPIFSSIKLDFNSIAYASGSVVLLYYDNTTTGTYAISVSGAALIQSSVDQFGANYSPLSLDFALSLLENKPLVIGCSTAFVNGNSTMDVTIHYLSIDV